MRTALALGTAATTDADAYATAAQGATADEALTTANTAEADAQTAITAAAAAQDTASSAATNIAKVAAVQGVIAGDGFGNFSQAISGSAGGLQKNDGANGLTLAIANTDYAVPSAISGTFANPTSITVVNGVITAIS